MESALVGKIAVALLTAVILRVGYDRITRKVGDMPVSVVRYGVEVLLMTAVFLLMSETTSGALSSVAGKGG